MNLHFGKTRPVWEDTPTLVITPRTASISQLRLAIAQLEMELARRIKGGIGQ